MDGYEGEKGYIDQTDLRSDQIDLATTKTYISSSWT